MGAANLMRCNGLYNGQRHLELLCLLPQLLQLFWRGAWRWATSFEQNPLAKKSADCEWWKGWECIVQQGVLPTSQIPWHHVMKCSSWGCFQPRLQLRPFFTSRRSSCPFVSEQGRVLQLQLAGLAWYLAAWFALYLMYLIVFACSLYACVYYSCRLLLNVSQLLWSFHIETWSEVLLASVTLLNQISSEFCKQTFKTHKRMHRPA